MIKKYLILLVFIFTANLVYAQTDGGPKISVAPHTFDLGVIPGQLVENKVKIINQSSFPIPIKVRIIDFTASEDSGQMVFDEQSQDPSFSSKFWFEIENPDFILDPGEVEKVNFKITVPENAEPGGHYAVMIFEPQLPSFYFDETALVKNIPEIGVLFLTSVQSFSLDPVAGDKLQVVEFSLPKEQRLVGLENIVSRLLGNVAMAADINITQDSDLNFILKIKNNDIYHLKPSGQISIYNSSNKRIGETEIPDLTILPGKTRVFPVEFSPDIPENLKWLPASISSFLSRNFFIGEYKAQLEAEAQSPISADLVKVSAFSLSFFSLPWKFWLITVFIFILFTFIVVKYRKRIFLSLKILQQK